VATTPLGSYRGLSREAFAKYDAAQAKTPLALRHRRRFALMQADVLARAARHDLTGRLDRQLVTIYGIAREPAESRPVIRGWLPPGFLPPQVTIASASAAPTLLLARAISSRIRGLHPPLK
jgi:hypothetical protein